MTIDYGSDHTTSTPLTMKEAQAMRLMKPFEQEQKVETDTFLFLVDDLNGARCDIVETGVIHGMPYKVLEDIEGIDKAGRNDAQFV